MNEADRSGFTVVTIQSQLYTALVGVGTCFRMCFSYITGRNPYCAVRAVASVFLTSLGLPQLSGRINCFNN